MSSLCELGFGGCCKEKQEPVNTHVEQEMRVAVSALALRFEQLCSVQQTPTSC